MGIVVSGQADVSVAALMTGKGLIFMVADIQVWADFHCPFCYIGKRKLRLALEVLGIPDAKITTRSFLLNPHPAEENGISLLQYVAGQYADNVESIKTGFRLREEEGRGVGLHMDMLRARFGDTRDAHRLFQFAGTLGLGEAFFDRTQRALFEEGLLISDPDVLLRLARETGLPPHEAREVLGSDLFEAELEADDREARAMDIDYVPYYIVNGVRHFSGDLSMGEYLDGLGAAADTEVKRREGGSDAGVQV